MIITVAQTRSIKGDILSNLKVHKKLINLAISYSADCIFFPELSLTGYEPELANELARSPDDITFDEIQNTSDNNKITIGLGMPTRSNSGIHISMIIFQPNAPRQIYSKQQLHSDELSYFIQAEGQVILKVANTTIAPAICYESLQADHSENANKLGAEIYIASVA